MYIYIYIYQNISYIIKSSLLYQPWCCSRAHRGRLLMVVRQQIAADGPARRRGVGVLRSHLGGDAPWTGHGQGQKHSQGCGGFWDISWDLKRYLMGFDEILHGIWCDLMGYLMGYLMGFVDFFWFVDDMCVDDIWIKHAGEKACTPVVHTQSAGLSMKSSKMVRLNIFK